MTGPGTSPPVRENFADDTVSDERFQKVKMVFGEDGSAENVTRLVGLPVADFTDHEILGQLLMEQRLTNLYLSRLVGEEIITDDLGFN